MNSRKVIYFLVILSLWGCHDQLFDNPDVEGLGITFRNTLTETNDNNILDYLYFYNGGGVSMGDIDNDGLLDLFFSGNQVGNKLYLNKGNLKFEDITEKAGVGGNSSWNTGTTMADVNGDGLLDIYVCAVVGINGLYGHNELYINQGNNTFVESAAEYGLDFDTFSSHAAFFDYDLDGDLDMYLLNHAVHTKESFGPVDIRNKRDYQTGDRLLRNDEGHFVDVSAEAGIYGGVNGYGLGLAISDFNQDGYPDIFVGNDFHEDDYYYLNNGDGTFKEQLRDHFGHTTRSSMGNDVADINHDGLPDLLSLDMLPEDEKIIKSSVGDDNEDIQKIRVEQFGYYYQFARNMLFLNQPQGNFMEIALMAGVAATDWSWSGLFGDFDQDGEQDLFVSNGITKRPNDKDFLKFISSDQIRNKINNTKLADEQAMKMMPSGKVHNYVFRGRPDLTFEDMSGQWIKEGTSVSGATAMGDLDNDGDLDLVVNNLDSSPSLYINNTNERAGYLKIRLQYRDKNLWGIGTKVFSYHKGILQYKELNPARGFQSSSAPEIYFGYGTTDKVDSLKIIWPDHKFQILKNVDVNQTLELSPNGTSSFDYRSLQPKTVPLFQKMEHNLGLGFVHVEDNYKHFTRERLIPYEISDRGPATVVGDLDGDGREDVFFGGSRSIPSSVYLQKDSIFQKQVYPSLAKDSIKEEVAATLADFDNDGHNDLYLGSGGADFYNKMEPLTNSLFLFRGDTFVPKSSPVSYENTSKVLSLDYDGDGNMDIFVANHEETNKFGKPVNSYLLKNNGETFEVVQKETFASLGMLTDAIWDDFDGDNVKDLIVIGEWMSPRFFKNTDGTFHEVFSLRDEMNGLWQCIVPFDIDGDGDKDYILGNWGENSKFKATPKKPMKLFCGDFDGNRRYEAIAAIEKNGRYFPFEGLDEMASQIPSLSEKFSTYASFAGMDLEQILGKEALERADVRFVHTLKSGYLKNENGNFSFVPFANLMQTAPIMALLVHDFDGDQHDEVLAAGNYFGIKVSQGRLDAFPGALITSKDSIKMGYDLGLDFLKKSVRHLNIVHQGGQAYLLVTINNGKAQLYRIKK